MPNRMFRDGFLDSDKINSLSTGAENFFVRLMLCADDYGRFDGRYLVIKSRAYPLKSKVTTKNIESWVSECISVGLIVMYEVDKKPFIEIKNFNQRLRAKNSKYPSCDGHVTVMCPSHAGNNLQDVGREEKGSGSSYTFDEFWNDYDKKRDRQDCETFYEKINEDDRMSIKKHIPLYKESEPTKKFRVDPIRYLKKRRWEDEIINKKPEPIGGLSF